MRRYLFLVGCLCLTMVSWAQNLSVQVPSRVSVGELFRLEYTIHSTTSGETPRLDELPDGLVVAYGPSVSQQESYSNVNGHVTTNASTTYTFMLQAEKPGDYTIPPARLNLSGKTLTSSSAHVKAVAGAGGNNGQTKFHYDPNQGPSMRNEGSAITDRDIFIRVNASKTHIYEQEPIVLTYYLCFLPDVRPNGLSGGSLDVKGCQLQEIELPDNHSFENINGRNYAVIKCRQYIVYPQMTGKLNVPEVNFKAEVNQRVANVDPMEAFFNGGSDYIVRERELVANGLTLQVDSLPSRPMDFTGAVGNFKISAEIDKDEVKAGEPINLRVIIGGHGNLRLLKQPDVAFPKDFDKYDAKVTDKTDLTINGVEGDMIFDFLAVPRNQGNYTIPGVKLTYFDTDSRTYKTIETEPFELKVLEGDGNSDADEFADYSNKDIYPIKEGKASVQNPEKLFFGSKVYWISILVPLLVFLILLLVFRKKAIDNANVTKMRGKKANKVATKRLKEASKLMDKGDNNAFYDEVLRALWGYVGDKLNMPVEQLSRDNVRERLTESGVGEITVDKFIQALDECEFERYAPGDSKGNMNRTFDAAVDAITKIEDDMKAKKGRKNTAQTALLLMMLLLSLSTMAVTKEEADAAYKKGNYQQAIKDYEELLKQGKSADLYYNLGNAYYRTEEIPMAILNYERAYILSPSDGDIRFNLQLARSKTIDKINPDSNVFFVSWYKGLVCMISVDAWAAVAVVSIVLVLALLLLYLFAERINYRKIGFYGAVAFFILFLLANLFAYQQKRMLDNENGAIVMAPTVNVKKNPEDNAANAFVLHEGTKVEITDKSIKGWREIRMVDGREGWMQESKLEEI